ncbi:MAG: hypothetical protein U1E76_13775 [Planctomycetota bacterium]
MFAYRSFGLTLGSEIELPELEPGSGRADAVIRRGAVTRPDRLPRDGPCFHAAPGDACLFLPDVGDFQVREGREIVVAPSATTPVELLRIVLLGSIMALLLQQRGRLVLHASAVARGHAAVGFLGRSGSGKSTLAAACLSLGAGLVTDDVLALDPTETPTRVFASYARLKLSDQALRERRESPADLPLVPPHADKRYRCAGPLPAEPLRLEHLYVLAEGPLALTRLGGQDALVELIRHTYAAHLDFLQPAGLAAEHLRLCAALVASTPISRLSRPLDFASLPDVVRAING